jgi:hypothetical protein
LNLHFRKKINVKYNPIPACVSWECCFFHCHLYKMFDPN